MRDHNFCNIIFVVLNELGGGEGQFGLSFVMIALYFWGLLGHHNGGHIYNNHGSLVPLLLLNAFIAIYRHKDLIQDIARSKSDDIHPVGGSSEFYTVATCVKHAHALKSYSFIRSVSPGMLTISIVFWAALNSQYNGFLSSCTMLMCLITSFPNLIVIGDLKISPDINVDHEETRNVAYEFHKVWQAAICGVYDCNYFHFK